GPWPERRTGSTGPPWPRRPTPAPGQASPTAGSRRCWSAWPATVWSRWATTGACACPVSPPAGPLVGPEMASKGLAGVDRERDRMGRLPPWLGGLRLSGGLLVAGRDED